jgi:hypothetical protein
MAKNRTHEKLDKLYADKKARNFINHLIRSYLPMNKVYKIMEKPDGKPANFKCALSNQPLVSINELLERLNSEETKQDFMNNIKNLFKEGDERYSIAESLLGRQSLGVQGKNTDTYMSYEAFQSFYDWVVTKMLMGDKHINWVLGKVNRSKFNERAENIENPELQAKLEKLNTVNQATFTLGDLGALQALKNKMDNE